MSRRPAVGIIAIVLLVGAAVLWLCPPVEGGWPMLEAAFWRVGAVMAVLWLAWPDLRRMPAWLLGAVPLVIILIAIRPRWVIFLVPVLVVIAVLRMLKRTPSGK